MQSGSPGLLEHLLRHPAFAQPLLTPAALWLRPLQAAGGQHLSAVSKQVSRVG